MYFCTNKVDKYIGAQIIELLSLLNKKITSDQIKTIHRP